MDSVYQLNCPLVDMSPIAVEPDFTRKYLESANNDALVKKIKRAFDRVAWKKISCCAKVRATPASVRCSIFPTRKSPGFWAPKLSSSRKAASANPSMKFA